MLFGQFNNKRGAFIFLPVGVDRSAMPFSNFTAQRQTQSCSIEPVFRIETRERFKDLFVVRLRETNTVVGNGDDMPTIAALLYRFGTDVDLRRPVGMRKFQRIA